MLNKHRGFLQNVFSDLFSHLIFTGDCAGEIVDAFPLPLPPYTHVGQDFPEELWACGSFSPKIVSFPMKHSLLELSPCITLTL